MRFEPRAALSGFTAEQSESIREELRALLDDLREELPQDDDTVIHTDRIVQARGGQFLRLHPPPNGQGLILPHPSTVRPRTQVTVSLEAPEGTLRIVAAPLQNGNQVERASVNGESVATYSAAGMIVLVSNGADRWQVLSEFAAESSVSQALASAQQPPTWADVLANGNRTGLRNPHVDTGAYVGFGNPAALPSVGNLRASGDYRIDANGQMVLATGATSDLLLTGGTGITNKVRLSSGFVEVVVDSVSGYVSLTGPLVMRGQSALAYVPSALLHEGVFWPDSTPDPCEAMFTDDAGDHHRLAYRPVPLTDLADVTGPCLLGLDTGTGAPVAMTGGEAGQLVKFSNDISATLIADQNDWAPTGLATGKVIFISTGGSTFNITGIDGSSIEELEGSFFFVTVSGNAGRVQFPNNSASSASGNRFASPIAGGATIGIGAQEWAIILRNGLFWYVMPCAPLLTGSQIGLRIRYTGEISPTIAAATHNWSPTGLSTAYSVKPALTGSQTLTGIDASVFVDAGAGNTADGVAFILKNNDATDILTMSNNSVSSLSGNRISTLTPAYNAPLHPGWSALMLQESGFWVPRFFYGPVGDDMMLTNISGATNLAVPRALSAMVNDGLEYDATGHHWQVDLAHTFAWTGAHTHAERASAPTVSAGQGSFWPENTAPTRPKFTDDVGASWSLGYAALANMASLESRTNDTSELHFTDNAPYSIPANTAREGSHYILRGRAVALRGSTATAVSITSDCEVAGVQRATTGAMSLNVTNGYLGVLDIQFDLHVLTIGAAGTAFVSMWGWDTITSSTPRLLASTSTSPFAFNTTIANSIEAFVKFNGAVLNTFLTRTSGVIRRDA